MCGRYTATFSRRELEDFFRLRAERIDIVPRYNIAPTQSVPVISGGHGERRLSLMRWGVTPAWSKTALINARAETLEIKATFRKLLLQRCLVPADGFYEWKLEGRRKAPYRVTLRAARLFAFAGLWSEGGEGERAFVIITTSAPAALQGLHDRMPATLPLHEQHEVWLRAPLPEALALLQPYAGELNVARVSSLVNSPSHDDVRCVQEEREG